MKGYGQDTESELGSYIERIDKGAVTGAIERGDELFRIYEKRVRKYFSQFPRTKVISIIREGWQVTYHLRTPNHDAEVEWCWLELRIQWPSAQFTPNWKLGIHWNEEQSHLPLRGKD